MRLLPRSTCAMAVVIDTIATSRPMTSATSPASLGPLARAPTSASSSPVAGDTALTVAATTRAGRSSSMSAASPITASRNGTRARQVCSASARLLVNPSP